MADANDGGDDKCREIDDQLRDRNAGLSIEFHVEAESKRGKPLAKESGSEVDVGGNESELI